MAFFSTFAENKLVDALYRAQALAAPATLFVSLHTTTSTAATPGTEVTGGSYARVSVTSALANWAGTQSAGSTTVSTGTGGTTSNNGTVTFPAPTANWGVITGFCLFDASTAGNCWAFGLLTTAKTVNNGDTAPSFAAAALAFTIT